MKLKRLGAQGALFGIAILEKDDHEIPGIFGRDDKQTNDRQLLLSVGQPIGDTFTSLTPAPEFIGEAVFTLTDREQSTIGRAAWQILRNRYQGKKKLLEYGKLEPPSFRGFQAASDSADVRGYRLRSVPFNLGFPVAYQADWRGSDVKIEFFEKPVVVGASRHVPPSECSLNYRELESRGCLLWMDEFTYFFPYDESIPWFIDDHGAAFAASWESLFSQPDPINETGKETLPAAPDSIRGHLDQLRMLQDRFEKLSDGQLDHAFEGLAAAILRSARDRGCSDIHIEPFHDGTRIRLRIDGSCVHEDTMPPFARTDTDPKKCLHDKLRNILLNRGIGLEGDKTGVIQDGRLRGITFDPTLDNVDFRVSVAPMAHGDKICMRVIDSDAGIRDLSALGFSENNERRYREVIEIPEGMVLHCGPTGSGKSVSMYSALALWNRVENVIVTAEDPVEIVVPGINQLPVNTKDDKRNYAAALRCFLRQDPDVILIGEIRDPETAKTAMEAALTGHLVFSTLHTNDAPTAILRLRELGAAPYLIRDAVNCICAQRLARRLCPECHQPFDLDDSDETYRGLINWAKGKSKSYPLSLKQPGQCEACNDRGFKGRIGLHEIIVMDTELRKLIDDRFDTSVFRDVARKHGMTTLFEDGAQKVLNGETSPCELMRVATPDENSPH